MTIRPLMRSRLVVLSLGLTVPAIAQEYSHDCDAMLANREWQRIGHPDERAPLVKAVSFTTTGGWWAGQDDTDKAKAVQALGESPLAAVFEAIGPDARQYAQHNITLSNPFMEGRIPGSHGNRVAADYIEFWFKKTGLIPAFPATTKAADGSDVTTPSASFRQPFKHGTEVKVSTQVVTLHPTGKEDMKLRPGIDFAVLGMSGSGEIKGDVIFCGYGIAEGPDNYRSIPKELDLSGKVALVMRFEPMDPNGKSKWVQEGWSPAASLDAKIEEVVSHHPAAILLINPPGAADPRAKSLMTLDGSRANGAAQKIPIVMIATELADRLLSFNGGLDAMKERADDGGGTLPVTDTRASIKVDIGREPVMTDNVGAVLPGRGALANQYIVIGAHYDHVGYGTLGADAANRGKIHPGADDNASGTSGVLLLASKLAEAYAKLPEDKPVRSVLFLTFSAEEAGLYGSIHYAAHPSVELSKISFMLNMDMIGRLRAVANDPNHKDYGLEVEGTESAEGFYDIVKPLLDSCGFEVKHGSTIASNSDHFSFYNKRVPILNFFSGYHSQYHKPTDTFDLINQVGAAKIVALAHNITLELAQRPEQLKFTSKSRDAKPAAAGPVRGGKVRFGIKPGSYDENTPGIDVEDVSEGTSAADAGIKAGDRMIKWNGKPLTDVDTWMPLLNASKVGDVVEVTVVRDGKEEVIKVTLKAAAQPQ